MAPRPIQWNDRFKALIIITDGVMSICLLTFSGESETVFAQPEFLLTVAWLIVIMTCFCFNDKVVVHVIKPALLSASD